MRRPEIAVDALLHVAALLRADDQHFFAMKTRHAADDGGIVAEAAVAVNFAEVGEDALDVVQSDCGRCGCRASSVFLPGGGGAFISCAQGDRCAPAVCDLPAGLRQSGASATPFRHLALDLLQFLLRFFCGCHESMLLQAMMRTLPRPHSCSTRAMKLRSGSTL